jgi:hypothetical protein
MATTMAEVEERERRVINVLQRERATGMTVPQVAAALGMGEYAAMVALNRLLAQKRVWRGTVGERRGAEPCYHLTDAVPRVAYTWIEE